MQDYEAFWFYISPKMWVIFEGRQFDLIGKLRLLVDHCMNLGLRAASEPTQAAMVAFLVLVHEGSIGARAVATAFLQDLLAQLKEVLKKRQKIMRSRAAVEEFPEKLSRDPRMFKTKYPAVYNRVFKDEEPVPPKINELDLVTVARALKLR